MIHRVIWHNLLLPGLYCVLTIDLAFTILPGMNLYILHWLLTSRKDKSLEGIELTDTFDVSLSLLLLVVVSIVEKYPCNLGPINLAFRIWGPG